MMLECEHCGGWRLLYCEQKLTKKERENVEQELMDVSFTCGAPLQDFELPGSWQMFTFETSHVSSLLSDSITQLSIPPIFV